MSTLELAVIVIILAFICEYIDSSLGMGYGTTLTPLLLLFGFKPLQIVPSILLSEFITGLLASFFHHRHRNVNFRKGTLDLKIAGLMGALSVVGALVAVFVAVKLPTFYLKLYIGLIVLAMGVIILITRRRTFAFSWKKLSILGLLAAFNKGISGGGYGPIVTGGQIISGVASKSAVGITSLAEGLTCLVGVGAYFAVTNHTIDWQLAPYLVTGAVLSVPLATLTVKKMKGSNLKIAVGVATLALGIFTLAKTIL
ncbi:MAG: sulfite exporter TauE/SafE family protein [Candidatus Aminicenantales bacterium]